MGNRVPAQESINNLQLKSNKLGNKSINLRFNNWKVQHNLMMIQLLVRPLNEFFNTF